MINIKQILNNQTWHLLKKDFQVVINTYSNDRKEVERVKKEISARLQKYKHRDKQFILQYPNSRMVSYLETVIDSKTNVEYIGIVYKLKLNISKGLSL